MREKIETACLIIAGIILFFGIIGFSIYTAKTASDAVIKTFVIQPK